jgi:peptidoglycan/LPS O-acetylase OafA/YrhL
MRITDIKLDRSSNNFDAIRLIAAVFVLIGHSSAILLNRELEWDPFLQIFGKSIHFIGVLIFFTISGFLLTRSWEFKKNILDFLIARFLRIFPALICVIILSVFVLGILITKYEISDYLSSPITAKYLQGMTLYRMNYYLPGVFESNPIGSSINGSLWTLPYEFTCYLFLLCFSILNVKNNKWFALFSLIFLAISYLLFQGRIDRIVIPILGIDLKTFFPLFLYFFSGSVYFHFIKFIPFNLSGLLVCGILIVLIKNNLLPELLFAFILPYLIFSFAFSEKIKVYNSEKYGDFSYGLYLYAFPIQQFIVYSLPIKISLPVMIFLSIGFTFPFAMLSWKFIEKPALFLRKIY